MFALTWPPKSTAQYNALMQAALHAKATRESQNKTKSSSQEGLFKQVHKSIQLLLTNPKHPSLNTHEYTSLEQPYKKGEKVFEAYAQNDTPGAYRIFWCYGPVKNAITIIAITPHP